jgi:epoxyqueuosine reductase
MSLGEQLRDAALGAGCCASGICSTERFETEIAALESRKAAGMHGRLGFTYGDPERAGDLRRSLPWARSLVVAAWPYLPKAGSPGNPSSGSGRIARFATEDHYRGLRAALEHVAGLLRVAGFRSAVLSDDARLIDRAAAVRAGVGWWGQSSMVLVPGSGPWVLLGSVATDAELPVAESMKRDCGSCVACIPACPTGAIVEPGVLDARLCLAHWLQAPGIIPRSLRRAVADRVYGCDDCLDVCPPGGRLLNIGGRDRGRVDLLGILRAADDALLTRFDHFYFPGRHPRYLRRNALVALGNTGGDSAAAVAAGFLGHPDWLLRAHAAWTVGVLAGSMSPPVLQAARRRERDARVVSEIDESLAEVKGSR